MRRYPVARSLAALSLVPLAGCTGGTSPHAATATSSATSPTTSPITSPVTVPVSATSSPAAVPPLPVKVCPVGAVYSTPPPEWTAPAHPPAGAQWVMSQNGYAVGVLFTDPPRAGQENKILWIVKLPRDGFPLQMRATPLGGRASIGFTPVPPDSGPGEIYPSTVSVPASGCWALTLSWGAVHDTVVVPFS